MGDPTDDDHDRTDCGNTRAGCLHDPLCQRHAQPTRNEMVVELHQAVHGASWARPESPSEVWRGLIAEVAALRKTGAAVRERDAEIARLRDEIESVAYLIEDADGRPTIPRDVYGRVFACVERARAALREGEQE